MNSTAKIFLISGIILIFLISSYSEEYEWTPVGAFGGQDCSGDSAEDGKFCEPRSIDIGFNNTIYVIDTDNDRFQVFDPNFTHVETDGGLDPEGIELGKFQNPEGIAIRVIDENISYVYITDTRNDRVEIRYQNYTFNNETNETTVNNSWGEFGEQCVSDCNYNKNIYFRRPKDIEVDSDGKVYIADTEEDRIQVIDNGFEAPAFNFSGADSVDGEMSVPEGIAVDSSGNIYVADTGNNKIRIFDPSGVQLRSFGSFGSGQKEFNEPS
ncbi:MAG: NHL repeat-containing protein, partial [Candidatus Altiarchaeales archaeon]|nr:NHL repeat-containing protein [Candidatus Altiarchaeota archaeon]MCG2782789.1 NHL repeat-containing protein [Candidatus Altiarchaeales archaeon]